MLAAVWMPFKIRTAFGENKIQTMATRIDDIPADRLWTQWMEAAEDIYNELVESFALRRQYRDFVKLFTDNARLRETGGHVWHWMQVCYVNTILVRIRRHVEGQTNEASLRQLLEEIKKRPDVPTRQRAVGDRRGDLDWQYPSLVTSYAENWANGVEDGPFQTAVVQADIARLESYCAAATVAANRHFIHLHRNVTPSALRVDDVDAALDHIENVFKRYHSLLLNAGLYGLEPTPQFNTHEVFTFPWREAITTEEWLAQFKPGGQDEPRG